MSLFSNTIITQEEQDQIKAFMHGGYSVEAWNKIADIKINGKTNLWRAVTDLKPRYWNQYRMGKWETFPDAITLARAIKKAVDADPFEEDLIIA